MHNDHPDDSDPLAPARGIILGVVFGVALLSAIFAASYTINLVF